MNEDGNRVYNKKKQIKQSSLDDIFSNQNNEFIEDEDFINKVYTNQTRNNYDDFISISNNNRVKNHVKKDFLSIDSNKRYKSGKKY